MHVPGGAPPIKGLQQRQMVGVPKCKVPACFVGDVTLIKWCDERRAIGHASCDCQHWIQALEHGT